MVMTLPGALVRARDGDDVAVGQVRVRLHGVDAFERNQTCERGGETWRCGTAAQDALQALVAGKDITCIVVDADRYGRPIGKCTADGVDLNDAMVRSGLAVAYRHYSSDYVAAEKEAIDAKRGAWAGTFTMPWVWRKQH
ncbi:MAG: thermonuclease family protein [Rhodobiaceae bacterium]|nr:thermonuclease family protein [Rhodobiaceae bacterium]